MNIKVLTLNCFGSPISFNREIRFSLIPKVVNEVSPNIAFLQEVIFSRENNVLKSKFGDLNWKYYDNQALLNKGGLAIGTNGLEINNQRFYKFTDQGGVVDYVFGDAILGKGFQMSKFRAGNKVVLVVNTHLICPYSRVDTASQENRLTQLIDLVGKQKYDSLILAGDLNIADPGDGKISQLKSELNLVDTLPDNCFTINPDNLNRKRNIVSIFSGGKSYRPDYIFISKDIQHTSAGIVFDKHINNSGKDIDISDHYGILVGLKI